MANSFFFVNRVKVQQFKAKDLEIKSNLLCLENTSKDVTIGYMKKTDCMDQCIVFLLTIISIDTSHILKIHECLMKNSCCLSWQGLVDYWPPNVFSLIINHAKLEIENRPFQNNQKNKNKQKKIKQKKIKWNFVQQIFFPLIKISYIL